ncbi:MULTISPECIES: pre-peptidase C-terminal domain-containing protein [Dyella]|uniref:PKD domain-containing protein n=2 Tax=Dyella TaxID=231454 RepID=A0A4R0YGY0_9GAMM|nr:MULTISPECIES: pre-peptidase C-terminal domain-containing protein [Dyella]TBR37250.1 PKD domain-containing protein [Dyella terrae]TCI07660.1 PKD domain-containing protein [Dyella soli]
MTSRKHLWGVTRGTRKALLPLAVSMAMMAGTSHAADSWVNTHTHAAMQKTAAPASTSTVSTMSASAAKPGWTLTMRGNPTVDDALVTPLEESRALHVAVSLKLRNQDQLQQFLHDLATPGTASYGQFLTPAQFKAKYSPTDQQVQAVIAHLQSAGFTNITVSPNHLLIEADGHASNVQAGFRATMKQFQFRGRQRIANDAEVLVPASLGDTVNAVLGLQDVSVKHTMYHFIKPSTQSELKASAPVSTNATAAAGTITSHNPTQFAAIYNAGSTPTASNTTVGIITWGSTTQTVTDLNTFTSNAGLPTVTTQTVKVGTATLWDDADADGEWDLDSQTIVGTSGGVQKLIFYTAANGTNDASLTDAGITAAYNKAVTDNVAKVINVSLGEDETAAHNSGTQSSDDTVFQQAVAQGQTFSISSGDEGVYEAQQGVLTNTSGTVTANLSAYSVSEPASSPYVVAVGGTTLSTTSGTTWAGETVWNEGLAYVSSTDRRQRLWATGGGVSSFETAPTWQTTALGSSITHRVLPDVAFDAAQSSGAQIVYQGSLAQIGGTSLASPIFVGVWARLQSANGNALPFPTSKMYADFPNHPELLHDVSSGNNGYNGYGYNAAAGWDYTTGFGSINISALNTFAAANWVSGGGTTGPTANFTDTVSGLTVNFTDSSTDTGGTISSRSWNFGDGSTSTATNPSHTYTAAGTYTVTLTVTDSNSKTSTKTQSVTVTSSGGGGNVLQNGVALTGQSAATGGQLSYTVPVPAGASNLVISISGGTGDADLYTKFGAAPTLSSYDCRPYVSGNTESCTVASPQAGTYYVMLNAYAAFSGVSIKATWSTGGSGGGNVLQNNVPVTGLSGSAGTKLNYTVTVPAGVSSLTIATSGGTGDEDLYVRFGAAPTTSTYDCRPYKTGNNESCTVTSPSAGTYYIMLNGYSSFSGVTLKANW